MRKILLIALPIAAALAVAYGMERAAPSAAVEVAAELAALADGKADGPTVVLPEGRLLVIEQSEQTAIAHFHVKLGSLDACAVGLGTTGAERAKSVAEHFVATALPVFLSHAHGRSTGGAVRFHGEEGWGVPGRTGFMGRALRRGDDAEAPTGAALFAGIPKLPTEGTHLVKAVLQNTTGAWTRSIELDGTIALESDAPFAGAAPKGPLVITQFAVIDGLDRKADAAARGPALAQILARPPWLPAIDSCPDLAELTSPPFTEGTCAGGRLADCAAECARGEGSSCYAAAVALEQEHAEAGHVLHLAACRHGHASGCTNAAAARQAGQGVNACSSKMFEAVCEKADDPWACVMLGRTLKADLPRARLVLAKACRLGQDDPACAAGKQALADLEAGR